MLWQYFVSQANIAWICPIELLAVMGTKTISSGFFTVWFSEVDTKMTLLGFNWSDKGGYQRTLSPGCQLQAQEHRPDDFAFVDACDPLWEQLLDYRSHFRRLYPLRNY